MFINLLYPKLKSFSVTAFLSVSIYGLSACANNTPANINYKDTHMSQTYPTKPYYFHYFSIAIPDDINIDKGIDSANFWGNEFRAYPIASHQDFSKLVEARIAHFQNHKLSQRALDYEKQQRQDLITLNIDAKIRAMNPNLHMTTALYKSAKYDENRYAIIANPDNNLDSTFNSTMYRQIYMYVPEQHKYIMTNQSPFPARFLLEEDRIATSKQFLDNNIRALDSQILTNPNVMAVGPIAWIKPDSHPTIKHTLTSQAVPMSIEVKTDGYRGERIKDSQTQDIKQFKAMNDNKARPITSGTREQAGIKGREICYYFPQGEYGSSAYVWCSWGTDGEKENLDSPFIEITMDYKVDGTETQTKQAMSTWNQLMNSLQKRGHS